MKEMEISCLRKKVWNQKENCWKMKDQSRKEKEGRRAERKGKVIKIQRTWRKMS